MFGWSAGESGRATSLRRLSLPAFVLTGALLFFLLNGATASAVVTGSSDAVTVANSISDGSPGLQTGAAFTIAGPLSQCANGSDDDGNGLVDLNDPGCENASDDSEEPGFGFVFGVPECQNGEDDDGDNATDFTGSGFPTTDPECASATDTDESTAGDQDTECETANEDDGDTDGGTFAAGDPECTSADDNDEFELEECGDGVDNDSEGGADLADPGCSFPYDGDESSNNPVPSAAVNPAGVSNSPLAAFPTAGGTFGVLTSGDSELADDPNNDGGSGEDNGGQAYGEAYDPLTLKIDINVPAGANCVGFDFRFLSEEFPEFVNAGFNDAFIAQLDQVSLSVTGQSISAPGDFAAGAGDQISVDSSGPSGMSDIFSAGTTYDGATPKLVARTPVSPGAHSVFLTIFDAGDGILDSAVFVDNLRVTTEQPGDCKSLSLEPFEGKSGVTLTGDPANLLDLSNDLSTLSFPVHCNLPVGNEINCNVNFAFSFTPPSAKSARTLRAKTTPLASGSASIPAGTTQQVTLPVTPEGKKAVQAAIDKPAKLKKKAKKLLKKAKDAEGNKAQKLRKKAKKLKKQAKALKKQPLGTVAATITNPSNGATDILSLTLPR
jgi:hypothetical protein